jgi:hypothetical protein
MYLISAFTINTIKFFHNAAAELLPQREIVLFRSLVFIQLFLLVSGLKINLMSLALSFAH